MEKNRQSGKKGRMQHLFVHLYQCVKIDINEEVDTKMLKNY